MDFSLENKTCSFCGEPGSADQRLVGGLGAMICFACLEHFHGLVQSEASVEAGSVPPWDEMSDVELLEALPRIQRSASQVNDFAVEWVGLLRERGISWAAIGQSLGVSRQAAWERFAKRAHRRADATG